MSIVTELENTTKESKLIIIYPTHTIVEQDDDSNLVKQENLSAVRVFSTSAINNGNQSLASSNIQLRDNDTILTTIKAQ